MAWWRRQQQDVDEDEALAAPRRRPRFARLLAVALLLAGVWFAPQVAVLTHLRERPLEAIASRLAGTAASGSATWNWFGTIEYRNIVLHDQDGAAVLAIEKATLDCGLVEVLRQFGLEPQPRLGTLRLSGVEIVASVERGGSSFERMIAPWSTTASTRKRPELELEVVDAGLTLIDAVHGDAWRIEDLVATGRLTPQGLASWTVAGRAVHAGRGQAQTDAMALVDARRAEAAAALPQAQVATLATAVMAREGGFSVSLPEPLPDDDGAPPGGRALVVASNQLPLGITELSAVRYGWPTVLDGLLDVRVDLAVPAVGTQAGVGIRGRLEATDVHVLEAEGLQERFHIERLDAPLDCTLAGNALHIRQFTAEAPLFSLQASGRLPLSGGDGWTWLEQVAAGDFTLAGDIDLAAVARGRPGGLELRPDVRVTAGSLRVAMASRAEADRRVLELRLATEDLEAIQGANKLRWDQPLSAWLRGSRSPERPELVIEEARVISPAFEVTAASQPPLTEVSWTADLERLVAELGELFDLQGTTLAGTARGSCRFSEPQANEVTSATMSASVDGFVLELPGQDRWSDEQLQVEATGLGRLVPAGLVIDQGHLQLQAGSDTAELTVTSPWLVTTQGLVSSQGQLSAPPGSGSPPEAEVAVVGAVERWHARLASLLPAISLDGTTVSGRCDLSGTVAAIERGWRLTRGGGEFSDVAVLLEDGRSMNEPRVVGSVAGTVFAGGRGFEISSAELLTATLSIRSGGFSYLPAAGASVGGQRLPLIRGVGQWQADVGRIEQWIVPPLAAASWPASGRAWGTFEVSEASDGVNVRVSATGNDLALARVPASSVLGIGAMIPPSEVWREPRATFVLEVTRGASGGADDVTINTVALASSTASFTASGSLRDLEERGFLELSGTATYDWDLLSRLATPWTGGRIRLAGSGGRPFAIRGPLSAPVPPEDASLQVVADEPPLDSPTDVRPVAPLARPDNWLAAARGLDADRPLATGRSGRMALTSSTPKQPTTAWLRSVSLETTLGWQAADVFGLPIEAGDMPMRLLEGQLAFGPFDIGASGGRLRGTPWLRFLPGPPELVVPPGRIVDRIDISQGMANRWMTWVAPLLGQATQIAGRISVDTAGTRVPLADPFGGQAAGQVLFEGVEVTPGAPAQPLVNLIGRLQGLFDPRFGVGDKVVLMRVRPEPVNVWLHERRIWHDGLVMDVGQLTVRTQGSVAADGTLAMDVEMAFRGDLAGQTPIVATLLRTPLLIPLKGTIDRPQFDASAIDKIFARIAANTANAVIGDGINRGLEAIFGNPQQAAPPR